MAERFALYARFSCDLQNPTSAEDQIRDLRTKIARRFPQARVTQEERDEAVSGTSLAGRNGLKRLLESAGKHPRPFDAVVVEDLSRLARNRADSIRVRETFTAHGVAVLSAADDFVDPESEAGLFLTGFKEIKAEADSRETGRRVRRGVSARTLSGWVSGRPTPFGYRRRPVFSTTEKDRDGREVRLGVVLEPAPVTAPFVARIFELYAQRIGLRRIAHELNQPGSPSRRAKPEGYATSFLRALLLNPVYLGQVVYARTKERRVRVGETVKRRKTRVAREDWSVKENGHEALVARETWETVQGRFEARRGLRGLAAAAQAGAGRRPASLLSGLVRCGVCGGAFVVWTSGANSKQRRCGNFTPQRRFACARRRSSGGDLCANATTIEIGVLERRVLDALQSRVLTDEGLRYLHEQRRALLLDRLRDHEAAAPALEREWADLTAIESRLMTAIKSGLPLAGLRAEAEAVAKRREAIAAERQRLVRLRTVGEAAANARVDDTPLRRLRDILDEGVSPAVRAALHDLIVRIEVGHDGGTFALIGDGPLEPLADNESLASVLGPDPHREASPRLATGAEPDGSRPRSRICMVGATGFEPATS